MQVGQFTLKGSWDTSPDDDLVIRLLPTEGRFYGQGWRPETQHFLRELEKWVKPGMNVLDFGCGTGILAIAAAKLGAVVTAVENDPEVCPVASEHFALNEVVVQFITEMPSGTFDVVVANLDKDDLEAALPALRRAVGDKGVALWRQ